MPKPNWARATVAPNSRPRQTKAAIILFFMAMLLLLSWFAGGVDASATLLGPRLMHDDWRLVPVIPGQVQHGECERQQRKEDETHSRREHEFQKLHFESLLQKSSGILCRS